MAYNRDTQIWVVPDVIDATRIINQGGVNDLDLIFVNSTSQALYVMIGGVPKLIYGKSMGVFVPNLVDNSGGGGTGSTINAVTDFPSTANAVHILALKINNLIASLISAGVLPAS